jgi:Fe2+ or Zn2+ uptake regulation protein
MIEQKQYNDYVLVCDRCGHEVKYFNNFREAVDYKKENGWKSIKHDNEWEDVCPDCRGE